MKRTRALCGSISTIARSPTGRRIAGSRHRLLASFTSFVAGESPEYRLAQQPRQPVPTVLTGARVRQLSAPVSVSCSRDIQLAIGKQASVGSDRGTAKLQQEAFPDPLLRRAALVGEGDGALGRSRQVGHDEADARV